MSFEGLDRRFNHGDIVKVVEDDRPLRVKLYYIEIYFYVDGSTHKELTYDLVDPWTDDFVTVGFDEEMDLLCRADSAEEFLADIQRKEFKAEEEEITVLTDDDKWLVDYLLDKYIDFQSLTNDLKGIAPKAAVRSWKKLSKECLNDLKELTGGDAK